VYIYVYPYIYMYVIFFYFLQRRCAYSMYVCTFIDIDIDR